MPEEIKLNNPWMVAVWPGMGNVAATAGYYLMAKLEMHLLAEFSGAEMFEIEHVVVKNGLILPGRLPRSRIFVWSDPREQRDIVVFFGEAQPAIGKNAFCHKLIAYAEKLKVERVFTFAAMATPMRPEQESRVFGAATDQASLEELKSYNLQIIEDGHISGLNGVLLAAAAERGLRGACLLGEMPHIFAQLPFPKASLAVLGVFTSIAGLEIDFTELRQQADAIEKQLEQLASKVEREIQEQAPEEESYGVEPEEEERLSPLDEQRIEQLFRQAEQDRSKAYELKQELDRLDVFNEYEDRFLDLFKKRE